MRQSLRKTRFIIFGAAAGALIMTSPALGQTVPLFAKPDSVGVSAERLQKLDRAVEQIVAQGEVKGIVTLLARHGKIVSLNVRGNRDETQAMSRDTIFRLASMSKPVTGVALMTLYEDGRFSLDDPITKFIPEFAGLKVATGVDAAGKPILEPMKRPPTMRELMSHRAGFGYGMFMSTPGDKLFAQKAPLSAPDLRQMILRIAEVPLQYQPGEHFAYSASIDIEGYIIEQLSGQKLGEFMQQRIFAPLHMVDTGFFVPQDKRSRLAAQYRTDASGALQLQTAGPIGGALHDPTTPPSLESGGGGLYSTADDYFHFAQMLANKGALGGVRILAPSTVELMQSNSFPKPLPADYALTLPWMFSDAMGFGLNMQISIDPRAAGRPDGVGTLSWNGASGVFWWADPANDVVFLGFLQNSAKTGPRSYDARFRQLVYQALTEPGR